MWTAEAADNLDAIVTYIELFHPPAATRMAKRLIELADSLVMFPHRGRDIGDGRREMTIVPPYVMLYRVDRDRVEIPRVRHGARDAGLNLGDLGFRDQAVVAGQNLSESVQFHFEPI